MRTLTFAVLRRLADGELHSGQTLARGLAVSRGSIWNALNEARAAGVRVQRVHGRGYRLRDRLDWLDAERIHAAVAAAGLSVRVRDCCPSTNAQMLILAEAGAPSGTVLAAEMQTHGRGRLGRPWHSGLASALTFSLLWRFDKPIAGLAGLSLATGVAIVRALREHAVDAQLKWPNDLLWHECKLGGILIEVRGDALGPCLAVIGVGLNVRLGDDEKRRIDQPAADLGAVAAAARSRSDWLIDILRALVDVLRLFDARGFAPLRSEWSSYHVHQDRAVRLTLPDGERIDGIALGIDADARLLLSTPDGVRALHAGDVSLRAQP
ncbi:MAG: biotin--[acetyl-CoA-carboxylase] ligase [Burkholderiales bacterium]|nr:biotin--[acetyl-CoA-carboxylase] ligase [Burkholderiales bacterium]